jgi:predicted  nucleic acid-binding Zn-ribbon protein
MGPLEWDQRIKALQAEIQAVGDDLSEKRTEAQHAEGLLKRTQRELEFYTTPPARNETRVYPQNRKEDRARLEREEKQRSQAAEAAEDALRPIEEQQASLQEELSALQENPPAVTKADLKKSYSAVSVLEQRLAKIQATRDSAINGTDEQPMEALQTELEEAKSAYELAASGVALGEATPADVQKAEKHLKQVRDRIADAEDSAASQKAAVSGYGRRIAAIEGELEQANDTHRIMVGLYGETLQKEAVERINQAIESIKADLGEVAQAHSLMARSRAGNSLAHGGIGLDLKCREYTTLHGLNTGRLLPDEAEVRNGVNKLLVGIGYPIQPDEE